MSNWHQQKAMKRNPIPLYHETQWTVVNNGVCMTVSRFDSSDKADTYAKNTGGYVLPPQK